MKLKDLTKHVSSMTDEELREHVRKIRHTKYVAKPAKAKHEADAVKVETRQRASKVDKLIGGMSDADKRQLLLLLEGGE
jgi:hypothetical protein